MAANDNTPKTAPEKKPKKGKALPIILIIVIILLLVAGGLFFFRMMNPDKAESYNRAVTMLDEGRTEEALALLKDLDYKDSDALYEEVFKTYYTRIGLQAVEEARYQDAIDALLPVRTEEAQNLVLQARYESLACQCLGSIINALRDPSSLVINNIRFYDLAIQKDLQDYSDKLPVCVFDITANDENGQPMSTSILFMAKKEGVGYAMYGSATQEEITNADQGNLMNPFENMTAVRLQTYEKKDEIGSVDLNRVRALAGNGGYANVGIASYE